MSTTRCIMTTCVKNSEGKQCFVPCGKCSPCLNRRASTWSNRLLHEEKQADTAYFITLTYANRFVPITRNGYLSVKKKDLQDYFKRMRISRVRKKFKGREIKYFAVGEYGGKIKRPHYHIILFNAELDLLFDKKDIAILRMSNFDGQQRVKALNWDKGHATCGTVSGASVGYVMKYISEPVKNFRINDDRDRPFSVMSQGLGLGYIGEFEKVHVGYALCESKNGNMYLRPKYKRIQVADSKFIAWHKADMLNRMYVNVDGKKAAMPRYYKQFIYTEKERKEIAEHVRLKFVDELLNDILYHYHSDEVSRKRHNESEARQFDLKKNFNNQKRQRTCKQQKSKKSRLQKWSTVC